MRDSYRAATGCEGTAYAPASSLLAFSGTIREPFLALDVIPCDRPGRNHARRSHALLVFGQASAIRQNVGSQARECLP